MRGLLQADNARLFLVLVAVAATALLALGGDQLFSGLVVGMVTGAAVVLVFTNPGDVLGVQVPEVQDLIHAGIEPGQVDRRLGVVAGTAETVLGTGWFTGRGHLVVAAETTGVVNVFDFFGFGGFPAPEGQGELVILDKMAGFAPLFLLGQGIGVLVVEIRHRRQFQLFEASQGVNGNLVRLPRGCCWALPHCLPRPGHHAKR